MGNRLKKTELGVPKKIQLSLTQESKWNSKGT